MDYVSNSVMMPFIALLSTILIGWVMTPDYVIDEMQRGGKTFRRKKLYQMCIRDRGYSDANYFTRVFKRLTGQTPSEYRMAAAEKAVQG